MNVRSFQCRIAIIASIAKTKIFADEYIHNQFSIHVRLQAATTKATKSSIAKKLTLLAVHHLLPKGTVEITVVIRSAWFELVLQLQR